MAGSTTRTGSLWSARRATILVDHASILERRDQRRAISLQMWGLDFGESVVPLRKGWRASV
jgi:hypothetical protein